MKNYIEKNSVLKLKEKLEYTILGIPIVVDANLPYSYVDTVLYGPTHDPIDCAIKAIYLHDYSYTSLVHESIHVIQIKYFKEYWTYMYENEVAVHLLLAWIFKDPSLLPMNRIFYLKQEWSLVKWYSFLCIPIRLTFTPIYLYLISQTREYKLLRREIRRQFKLFPNLKKHLK